MHRRSAYPGRPVSRAKEASGGFRDGSREQGAEQLRGAGQQFEIEPDRDIYLGGDLFRVRIPDPQVSDGVAIVTLTLQSARSKQLLANRIPWRRNRSWPTRRWILIVT